LLSSVPSTNLHILTQCPAETQKAMSLQTLLDSIIFVLPLNIFFNCTYAAALLTFSDIIYIMLLLSYPAAWRQFIYNIWINNIFSIIESKSTSELPGGFSISFYHSEPHFEQILAYNQKNVQIFSLMESGCDIFLAHNNNYHHNIIIVLKLITMNNEIHTKVQKQPHEDSQG